MVADIQPRLPLSGHSRQHCTAGQACVTIDVLLTNFSLENRNTSEEKENGERELRMI